MDAFNYNIVGPQSKSSVARLPALQLYQRKRLSKYYHSSNIIVQQPYKIATPTTSQILGVLLEALGILLYS